MTRLGPVSPREIVRRLRALQFQGPFPGGKHQYMVRAGRRVRVPNPHGAVISTGLLVEILRQAGVSREDWESVA